MLNKEQIFNLTNKDLETLILELNQIHVSLKAREIPESFSYLDYRAKKEDVLSDKALSSTLNKLGINESKLTCEKFYKHINPTLNAILERKIFNAIKGYDLEMLRVQISPPLDVLLLVDDLVPPNDVIVPKCENVKDISYGNLEFEILESLKNIKYILNNGQNSRYCCLEYDSECIKAIRAEHDFYDLNNKLKLDKNKKQGRIKI